MICLSYYVLIDQFLDFNHRLIISYDCCHGYSNLDVVISCVHSYFLLSLISLSSHTHCHLTTPTSFITFTSPPILSLSPLLLRLLLSPLSLSLLSPLSSPLSSCLGRISLSLSLFLSVHITIV